ncbi:mannitol dehydrogenase family protein [Blastomonas aquatica]|uniref:Mannitol dehydrogenase n=1 Tax=Blastomonas aquatica TaxID=1510276 RepID=A0ABQ1J1E2_9SPHN|nr:mannitol dehydrogenase family protein [Blastomonas aquatica]GGB56489.1 mannitol dehydrogenase [Blastomonas aquatica]
MRISQATLSGLAGDVARPGYDVGAQRCGIVHFGIGAFHRAHQAVYTDDAMAAGDRDWRIIGVSLRSGDVADQLNPQDGLYTVVQRSSGGASARLIGAVSHVIVAPQDPDAVIAALASADTHIVSFTITEKGYHRRPDGALSREDAALASDLAGQGPPRTIYGFLAAGLAQRRAAGLPGLTLVSCDNLANNGARLMSLMRDYLGGTDAALAEWFVQTCRCPSTMVDRIVPAVTDADRSWLADRIGLQDAAAVITEPFCQWVIEDDFAGPRPRWEAVGAQIVADVGDFEAAKLRMLNGAHSALAYLGLARGYQFVHEAIADPALAATVRTLMRCEAAPTLRPAPGLDLDAYADALIARFANTALPHRLIQIAMDGSQKIPQRWLETLAVNQAEGRSCAAILEAVAAWIVHVRGDVRPVDDPMAAKLADLWAEHGAEGIAAALFGEGGVFSATWTASPEAIEAIKGQIAGVAA